MPLILALLALASSLQACGFDLPTPTQQCVVGIPEDWNSSHVTLRLYQKSGSRWSLSGAPIKARLGRDGLAWGIGLHPTPPGTPLKREGDWRSPAGVFSLGGVWGYAADVKRHPAMPYHRITERHLWIEDPLHPAYNQPLVLDHPPATPWERKQQMKQEDPAHSLKMFIAHNSAPGIRPGMGSSIFFHIWRSNGSKPTAGCTTMSAADLHHLIAWLQPPQKPLYILLPRAEFQRFGKSWNLPGRTD